MIPFAMNDITLVKRAIAKRVGHELVPGSPAWIREIRLIDQEIWACIQHAPPAAGINFIESMGGLEFMEQFADEFVMLELEGEEIECDNF